MDSLSQIVLGASLAAAIAPAQNRRAALLAGAVLGTLPDLDVFPLQLLTDNPVAIMTLHRGASHSLFVLPLVGWLIWWLCKRSGKRVAASPTRWFWAIQAALITHPILDAFTVYGTQLFWPLMPHPVMWSSLFIIDPFYTIWLLLGCLVAFFAGRRRIAQVALVAGLVLSTAYIGWSLAAKSMADNAARETLAQMGLKDTPFFSVPTPLTTLVWRVVAMDKSGGFFEGEYSVLYPDEPIHFVRYPSATEAMGAVSDLYEVKRLHWFNRGFMKAQIVPAKDGNRELLVLSDIRMGQEPAYYFNFAVAERDLDNGKDADWQEIAPFRLIPAHRQWLDSSKIWQRITTKPAS